MDSSAIELYTEICVEETAAAASQPVKCKRVSGWLKATVDDEERHLLGSFKALSLSQAESFGSVDTCWASSLRLKVQEVFKGT